MKEIYLKLMTYNIHSGKDKREEETFHKMIQFFKEFSPDILAIQEINENKKRGFQITELINLLQVNYHFGSHVKIDKGKYGIATFTPYPIIKKQHILLPCIGEQRGIIHTSINIKNKRLDILNTHFGLNSLERKFQFSTLQKHIDSLENSFIIMGDFNTTVPLLKSFSYDDTSSWNQQTNIPTLVGTSKRIDFILISRDIITLNYQVLPIFYSDHYPVTSKIKI